MYILPKCIHTIQNLLHNNQLYQVVLFPQVTSSRSVENVLWYNKINKLWPLRALSARTTHLEQELAHFMCRLTCHEENWLSIPFSWFVFYYCHFMLVMDRSSFLSLLVLCPWKKTRQTYMNLSANLYTLKISYSMAFTILFSLIKV